LAYEKGGGMAKKFPKPEHLVYQDSVQVEDKTFEVGESVWIEGFRKSQLSHNLIGQIIHNTRSGELYVNVFCERKGRGQWHSFEPSRLVKRNKKGKK
jgi:hypothetical protein